MSLRNILLVSFCLLTKSIFAQTGEQEIRLLDLENAMPITQATFIYGQQHGVSDENGVIHFHYNAGTEMSLSHVNYGEWMLDDYAVKKAMDQQVYYRKSIAVNLYPVTIIGMRSEDKQPQEELHMAYQDRMAQDGAGILNQLPAFNSIRKSGSYGLDPVFRGFKYDQLNVVMNGAQSATAACPNRMDPPTSQMAPDMMDRIEILKGPYALRYGTGFGATINFIPTKLRFTSETEPYGRVSAGYEGNGNVVKGDGHIGLSGAKYDGSLFASWSQGDDYSAGNGKTIPAGFSRGSFGTNWGFRLSSNQQLRISAVYDRARDIDFPALAMDLRTDDTWMFNARHDIRIQRDKLRTWNTTVYASFVDHLMDNLLKPLDPRMLNAGISATAHNYGARTEGMWQLGRGKLYGGADLRVDGAEGTRTREFLLGPNAGKTFEDNAWQDGHISKTGVFAEYQLKGKAFDYVVSGRLELNRADINDPSSEFTQVYSESGVTQVNPSVSLGIMKDLGKAVHTGLWLGRVQRSGGLTERYINYFAVGQDPYEMLGNPHLDPEVNNQVDLTFQLTPNTRTAVNLDLFASYMQHYISSVIDTTLTPRLSASPGVRRFVNIDNAFKTGFEISWTQQLVAGLQHQLGIAYTYGQNLESDAPLPEIAPLDLRYALSGSYLKNKLTPAVVFRYVAAQNRISDAFGETASPSFTLLDIKIGYQLTDKLSVDAGVNNVFDKNYYEHLTRPVKGTTDPIYAPGRNVFTDLSFAF